MGGKSCIVPSLMYKSGVDVPSHLFFPATRKDLDTSQPIAPKLLATNAATIVARKVTLPRNALGLALNTKDSVFRREEQMHRLHFIFILRTRGKDEERY